MGKYYVMHTCKHEEEVQLFGPMKGRHARVEWLAKQPCPACRQVALVAQRAEGLAVAAQWEQSHQMPAMVGTEKQIAWARQLRYDRALAMTRWVYPDWWPHSHLVDVPTYEEWLMSQTSASWWIDHRNKDVTATDITSLAMTYLRTMELATGFRVLGAD